ncbi:MAG: glycosyltransferase family 2 protein [Candidatus Omnitrophica bacterium]|nr:glycosyltransferase family 2 protein [Candidatus Omnitrophota bacterium]
MKLSVLVPVYNEVKTLLSIIDKIKAVNVEKEIILVDDCSTDGTRELLRKEFWDSEAEVKVLYHEKNMGKGRAVRTALDNAAGEFCIIQDADLEYDPNDFKRLVEYAGTNSEIAVYGSRFLVSWKSTSFPHFIVNKTLTVLTNILFGSNLTDMETCYKLIRTDVMKELDLRASRFELEPEITSELLKKGYKIPEIAISYNRRTYHEGKKIGWRDGLEAVWTLFKLKFRSKK